MKTYFQKTKKGFTLLETLVAIAILTMAIGAAFGVAQKSFFSANQAKNQTTAVFLASEGIELVRTVRDNVAFYNASQTTPINWLQPFIDTCPGFTSTDRTCSFDINPRSTGMYIGTITRIGKLMDPGAISSPPTGAKCADPGNTGTALKKTNLSPEPDYYTSTDGTIASIFSRKICISPTEIDDGQGGKAKEAIVTVTITWLQQSFTLTDTLTNWQKCNNI